MQAPGQAFNRSTPGQAHTGFLVVKTTPSPPAGLLFLIEFLHNTNPIRSLTLITMKLSIFVPLTAFLAFAVADSTIPDSLNDVDPSPCLVRTWCTYPPVSALPRGSNRMLIRTRARTNACPKALWWQVVPHRLTTNVPAPARHSKTRCRLVWRLLVLTTIRKVCVYQALIRPTSARLPSLSGGSLCGSHGG